MTTDIEIIIFAPVNILAKYDPDTGRYVGTTGAFPNFNISGATLEGLIQDAAESFRKYQEAQE